jgi:hypothetical protein
MHGESFLTILRFHCQYVLRIYPKDSLSMDEWRFKGLKVSEFSRESASGGAR